jgi:hypothetical protein
MKRQHLFFIALVGLLMLAILPALAASVTPTKVGGNASCASVASTGDFSLKIEPVVDGTFSGPGGVSITIVLNNKQPHTFGFSIEGGLVHDVLVKGSATNHYDYAASEGGPVSSDNELTIPNGNSLRYAIFCYDEVEEPTFSISGTKFEDLGEGGPGLAGWTIVLDGETTTVTDEDGNYSFTGVSAGPHTVCEELQEGWTQTQPTTEDGCHVVDTTEGDVIGIDFGNEFDGAPLECGGSADAEGEGTTASFTRIDDGDCNDEEAKSAFVDIDSGNEGVGDEVVTFIPHGEGSSNYQGTLSFVKAFDDPNLLVLQYDPDADGPEDFKDMQACDVASGEGFSFSPPVGESWCYFGVMAEPFSGGLYEVSWQVFGTEDPKFR